MSFASGPDLLFVPGDRPERYEKAAARASAVIIDLEDAVAPADKAAARAAMEASRLDPATTVVRLNPRGGAFFEEDLAALRRTAYRQVMVPKAAGAADVTLLDGAGEPYAVAALIETAAGVAACEEVAAQPQVAALMWGAEDLIASMDGTASRRADGGYRDVCSYARSRVLIAAKAHGKAAIDAVYLDLADGEGLRAEALDAAASGFDLKAVLHPDQAAIVREAYRPSADQVAWARRVLAGAATATGTFVVDGGMVDEVVLKRARLLVARAG
ncbi:MAG: CoA ester lyase [Arthrobacter sp.]|jgi:citrate lyase subunit beta/citryl-CoA lyase|nr:CoA ester lyase [Arthrobacter sp.]